MPYKISEPDFESLVTKAIEDIPTLYQENLKNIAFFVEDEPSQEQREKLNLRSCDSLFGLYEGVPLPGRRGGYALTLPDKITIFRKTHEQFASSLEDLKRQTYNTVWHEVAHYYGLDHKRIHQLERHPDK